VADAIAVIDVVQCSQPNNRTAKQPANQHIKQNQNKSKLKTQTESETRKVPTCSQFRTHYVYGHWANRGEGVKK